MPSGHDEIGFGQPEIHFENFVFGTWGQFESPSGEVLYLSTQVNLRGETDHDRRLIDAIAPVREALDVKELEFSELLQRDLDDHRVLTGLIPYLMEDGGGEDMNSPTTRFFPPVLAVLLPFENGRPSFFNEATAVTDLTFLQQSFTGISSGSDFRFSRLTDTNRKPRKDLRVARLDWNSTKTRLVVIDGQHRAMALLALYRTLSNKITWESSGTSAAKYMHFYKDLIMSRYGGAKLPSIELPVTICVFPNLLGDTNGMRLHRSARRLFVDVNREAKPPSQSRLVLLSESNLKEIFTRSLLDEVRKPSIGGAKYLPLFAVEYDSPSTMANNPQAQKTTCITDVGILRNIVRWLIWGPESVLESIKKIPERDKGGTSSCMRKQLDLYFEDEKEFSYSYRGAVHILEISQLDEGQFPTSAVVPLTKRFIELWGTHVLQILSSAQPFAAFCEGLVNFDADWKVDPDHVSALAREALFDGVGTYFTLKKLNEDTELGADDSTDWGRAWSIVEQKEQEFRQKVAQQFAGSVAPTPDEIKVALRVLERAKTNALQIAYVMAFESIGRQLGVKVAERSQLATFYVNAINSFMGSTTTSGIDRRYFWADADASTSVRGFLSFSKKTQKSSWVYYRWLLIEIFSHYVRSLPTAIRDNDVIAALVSANQISFDSLVESSRAMYLEQVRAERVQTSLPKDASTTQRQELLDAFNNDLKSLYQDWFEVDIDSTGSTLDGGLDVAEDEDGFNEDGDVDEDHD